MAPKPTFTTVLGERLGLWKGLIINMHLEGRVGDDVNGLSGLSPANSPMLMPSSEDEVALTQFMAIQMLRPDFGIAGGKFSAYDFTDMAFHTGRGIDGFMNISLVLPLGLGSGFFRSWMWSCRRCQWSVYAAHDPLAEFSKGSL